MTDNSAYYEELFGSIDPETEKMVSWSVDIVEEIRKALEEKEWSQKDLAVYMGKRPSEISKWLSGTHNFTLKTLASLSIALNKDLFRVDRSDMHEYLADLKNTWFFDSQKSKQAKTKAADFFEIATQKTAFYTFQLSRPNTQMSCKPSVNSIEFIQWVQADTHSPKRTRNKSSRTEEDKKSTIMAA